ncbi:hypothetical protein BASA60_009255 [Batrachochytrium salamandrivorans]|nr:hypothetical protein BASA60_009255 [Batrachochytrium salamandrivorans]
MKPILARIHALEVFPAHLPPNHCLVNEYRPGQGIMPHLDGPCYASVVATVSLGEATLLDFYRYNPQQPDLPVLSKADPQSSSQSVQPKAFSVVVEPLSLLVLEEEAYESYMHGIDESFGFWVDTDPHDGSTILNASSVMARLSAADSNRDSSLSVSTLHSIEANESSVEHSAANMSNAAIYIHRVGTRISLTFSSHIPSGKVLSRCSLYRQLTEGFAKLIGSLINKLFKRGPMQISSSTRLAEMIIDLSPLLSLSRDWPHPKSYCLDERLSPSSPLC